MTGAVVPLLIFEEMELVDFVSNAASSARETMYRRDIAKYGGGRASFCVQSARTIEPVLVADDSKYQKSMMRRIIDER